MIELYFTIHLYERNGDKAFRIICNVRDYNQMVEIAKKLIENGSCEIKGKIVLRHYLASKLRLLAFLKEVKQKL